MVVKVIRPDDAPRLRKGRYVTILNSEPEPVYQEGRPIMSPGYDGYEVCEAVDKSKYGVPLRVMACEWPFLLVTCLANTHAMKKGQLMKIDMRGKELAFISPNYARSFDDE